jgi:hypothetical protein
MTCMTIDLESYLTLQGSNSTGVRVLKGRSTEPYEFTLHPYFRFNETPEQRAKRELGFPIEGIEP